MVYLLIDNFENPHMFPVQVFEKLERYLGNVLRAVGLMQPDRFH